MNAKEFKEYIMQFGITDGFIFQDDKKGIRLINKEMMSVKVKGEKGLLVYKNGITKAFVSIFKAKKRLIELNKKDVLRLAEGGSIKMNLDDGEYIGTYKGIGVLPLRVEKGKAISNWRVR